MCVDRSLLLFLSHEGESTGSIHSLLPVPRCLEAAASGSQGSVTVQDLVTVGLVQVRGFLEFCATGHKKTVCSIWRTNSSVIKMTS